MSENGEQIEFWNGPAGERWAAFQVRMDRALAQISDAALAFAAPKPGERVLDIGCGAGATSFGLAEAVAPDGRVTGVDVSAPMLAVARARGHEVVFVEADAAACDFKPEYDLVFSRFGVMFFADPVAAFRNIATALRPEGRVAFVCWRPLAENLWAAAPMAAARPFLPQSEPVDPLAPGPFAFADAQRLRDIMSRAGFASVQVEKFDGMMDMGATLDEALDQSLKIGPLSRALADADDATRAQIAAAVRMTLRQFERADGIKPPVACWLVRAKL